MDTIEIFLKEVIKIKAEYEKELRDTGKGFNVFKILGLSNYEVRTHSAFIAELLNPIGSHRQGSTFLELFLQEIKVKPVFDIATASVEKEFRIGAIDKDSLHGGSIDILIKDINNHCIKIENKIYARDQFRQLLRYYNYNHDGELFYLTLNGTKPSPESADNLEVDKHYKKISYSNHIKKWLMKCKEKVSEKSILFEAIDQYLVLIQSLTSKTNTMSRTKEILKGNIEYLKSVNDIKYSYDELVEETLKSIWEECKGDAQEFHQKNGISFRYRFGQDEDGFYLMFQVFRGEEDISKTEEAKPYRYLLQSNLHFNEASGSLGWINPTPFKKGEQLEDSEIFFKLMAGEVNMEEFLEGILNEKDVLTHKYVDAIEKKHG